MLKVVFNSVKFQVVARSGNGFVSRIAPLAPLPYAHFFVSFPRNILCCATWCEFCIPDEVAGTLTVCFFLSWFWQDSTLLSRLERVMYPRRSCWLLYRMLFERWFSRAESCSLLWCFSRQGKQARYATDSQAI